MVPMETAKPFRKHISTEELNRLDPKAYDALNSGGDLDESIEDTDLSIFTYDGEIYAESHDEYYVAVWRRGAFLQLGWKNRPL